MPTSLRIQGHFFVKEATTGERKKSILMTCHYPHLGNAFDWLKQISRAKSIAQIWVVSRRWYAIPRNFGWKLVVTSQNIYCFLKPT